ncbi:transketolase C-terminal domain-containing protein [Marispirochaeta aestuarii]|uniref:transketolase family protein n=1 Tax=Marispirochaeta aestuarii TaxID=1963862 RepID=UPI002ABD13D0|nr:transketolase C-terminal domain-containing protein [Marispirochaeta aestuarii]
MAEYKGTREAFAAALAELRDSDPRYVFVSPDSLKAMRATGFSAKYPEAYMETGISEQNAVDLAAGLSTTGLVPFVATYAGFLTMRACEQMRTFVAYPNLNVKFVGINAGLYGGEREGVTHQFYEDIGILANIPNFTLFTPADGNQTYHAVKRAAEIDGPVYIRAGSGREKDIYEKNDAFNPDGVTVLKQHGADVLLLSSGFVLGRVLEAAEHLESRGLKATVADVNILYSKDPSRLLAVINGFDKIVTVEDHNINGGLGGYVAKLVCENKPALVKRIGLSTFGESGPAEELIDHYGFHPEQIADTVSGFVNRN